MNFDKLIQQLHLDQQEFLFQFQSHPNYPSALAFSDTLNFLGFKNDAYELEKEYWDELPTEFIAIHKDNFALVQKQGSQAKVFSNDVKELAFDDVVKNSQEFVLLFERTSEAKTKKENKYQFIFLALGILLLLISGMSQNCWFLFYSALTIAGIYILSEIFMEKFGNVSEMVNNFCGGGKSSSQKEDDCQKIFKSKEFQIFGLNIADFGLAYFVTLGLLGFILSGHSVVFKVFSSLAILAVFYSIYYQIKTNSFCKICALIIAILLLQFVVIMQLESLPIFDENNILGMLTAIAMTLIGFSAVYFFNKNFTEKEDLQKDHMKNLRFKRNYDLFKSQLLSKEPFHFENQEQVFFFGEKNSPLQISLISNPYCGFCKEGHEIAEKIRAQHPEVSLQLRFNFQSEYADDKYRNLMNNLVYLDETKNEQEMMEVFNFWFNERNEQKLEEKFNVKADDQDLSQVENMAAENQNKGFSFTPIIILNGYQFPENYDREDLLYFIGDLLEDEDVIR